MIIGLVVSSSHDMLAPSTAEERGRTGKEGENSLLLSYNRALPESIDLLQVWGGWAVLGDCDHRGLHLSLSVCLGRAEPLLGTCSTVLISGSSRPDIHWFTRRMGINRANPTSEVASHWVLDRGHQNEDRDLVQCATLAQKAWFRKPTMHILLNCQSTSWRSKVFVLLVLMWDYFN